MSNKEEAIEKHLDKFIEPTAMIDEEETRDYYRRLITPMKSDSKEAKKLFKVWFANGEALFKHMNAAGIEFSFKMYYNYS